MKRGRHFLKPFNITFVNPIEPKNQNFFQKHLIYNSPYTGAVIGSQVNHEVITGAVFVKSPLYRNIGAHSKRTPTLGQLYCVKKKW